MKKIIWTMVVAGIVYMALWSYEVGGFINVLRNLW